MTYAIELKLKMLSELGIHIDRIMELKRDTVAGEAEKCEDLIQLTGDYVSEVKDLSTELVIL